MTDLATVQRPGDPLAQLLHTYLDGRRHPNTADTYHRTPGRITPVTTPAQRPANEGWFADLSDEDVRNPAFPWQPFLQTDGCCFPLPVWFATKGECEDFIREDVAGRRLLEDG